MPSTVEVDPPVSAPLVNAGKRTRIGKQLHRSRFLYAMLLLPVAYFVIFHYGPMFGNLMAFKEYSIMKGVFGSPWAGFKYFEQFLFNDYFWKVVKNTLILNIYSLIFYFPAPILFAILLNELVSSRFRRAIQTISYIPHFLSTVVVAGMLVNFLSVSGMINQVVEFFGGSATTFLAQSSWFRTIFISSEIWQGLGWSSIIYMAALTGIDPGLNEAATIDGASRLQKMWFVTLPCIQGTITILFILAMSGILNSNFDQILVLRNSLNQSASDVIDIYVYRMGISLGRYSYATAVGLFKAVIALILLLTANKVMKKLNGTSLF